MHSLNIALQTGVRMMSGISNYDEQLKQDLSLLEQREDTILLNYDYEYPMNTKIHCAATMIKLHTMCRTCRVPE